VFPKENPPTKIENSAENIKKTPSYSKEIIAFYPSWNLSSVNQVDLSRFTQIYFFSLTLTKEGEINKSDLGGKSFLKQNFNLLKEKLLAKNVPLGISISGNNESISFFASNPDLGKKVGENLSTLFSINDFSGLNLDFEYSGSFTPELKNGLTLFLKNLVTSFKKTSNSKVSFALFADTFVRPTIYALEQISSLFDYIIIMGYDLNKLDSIRSGPVSPLNLNDKYDIADSISDFTKQIAREKLILALPLYGYDWPTETREAKSFVIKSENPAAPITLRQAFSKLERIKTTLNHLDSSAWFTYTEEDSNTIHQVWFDDETTLNEKCSYVNQNDLRGIGFFAIGYEPNEKNFWPKLTNCL
jgi:spore germination protein YaaH